VAAGRAQWWRGSIAAECKDEKRDGWASNKNSQCEQCSAKHSCGLTFELSGRWRSARAKG
jgi:hypothetical protein